MITDINISLDYYFMQKMQIDYILTPETGPHAGHNVQHTEIYHNCGVWQIDEYCQTCHRTLYENFMNGCPEHQREGFGEMITLSDADQKTLYNAETEFINPYENA